MRKLVSTALALTVAFSSIATPITFASDFNTNHDYQVRASKSSDYRKKIASFSYRGLYYKKWAEGGNTYFKFKMPGGVQKSRTDADFNATRLRGYMDDVKSIMKDYSKELRKVPTGLDKDVYVKHHFACRDLFFELTKELPNSDKTYGGFTLYDLYNEDFMRKYEEDNHDKAQEELLALLYEERTGLTTAMDDPHFQILIRAMKTYGKCMKYYNEIAGRDVFKSSGIY